MILKRNHDVSDSNEDFKKMPHTNKILLNDIKDRITCALCKGYFIDATTIIECLHTFCRSCIVKYLETHKYCPICDVQVHKTKPLANIRPDKIIQDIVYKLVPRLYHDEMRRRREFYSAHTEAKPTALEEKNEVTYEYILTSDENVCVALNYTGFSGSPRYLKCPAAVTIGHLEKLIVGKYDLSPSHRVTMFYNDDALNSHSSLMEIAYIYSWRRKGPLELTYRIYENRTKRLKLDAEESSSAMTNPNNNNNNNWKEVQLRISENGEISVTGIQDDIKDAVDDLGIVIKSSSEDEETQNVAGAPEAEKMDVDEPCEIVVPKGHKKLSNGSKRNEITGVLKVAKVRIRKIKSPKSKEKKEKKAKRGRRKKNDEHDLNDRDKDPKKDVNKNLEESVKPVDSVSIQEMPKNPEDSNGKLHESSGNQLEFSGNKRELSGNQLEPSGNQLELSGNQLEPSGNQLEPSGNQLEPSGNQVDPSGNRHKHSGNHHSPIGNQHQPSGNQHQSAETLLNHKEITEKGEICDEKESRCSNGEDKMKKMDLKDATKSSQPPVTTNQRSDPENVEKTEKIPEGFVEKSQESTEKKTGIEDKSLKQGDNNKTLDNSECIVDKKTKDLPKSEEKNSDENDKNLHNDKDSGSNKNVANSHNKTGTVPKLSDSQQSTKKTTQISELNRKESNDDSQVTNLQNHSANQSWDDSKNHHNVNKILNDGSKTFPPNSTGNLTMLPGNQTNLPGNQTIKSDPTKKNIAEMMEKVQTTTQIAALNCFPGIPTVFSEFKAPIACTKTVTASCTLTASTLSNSTADFRRAKHKIEEKADYEPSPKQPTILNHTLGLQNLSNNHPLKKHALSKPEVATNSPKPVKPTTSSPCYMPRTTVYSPVINVPKPQTSTQAKITDSATKKEKAPPATILNSKVSIKPKPSSAPMGYKTLRDPPKSWNPQIARPTLNRNDPKSPGDQKNSRPPKFFKMRNNLPRYLGNPASGVKPMYQLHISPEKDKSTVPADPTRDQTPKTEIKKHSIVKIDPKTLKPISERAPETSNLCRTADTTADLKINTSSVSIFNPLKLQCSGGSPKNDRKSPHSPKVKGVTSTSPPGRKDRVNLNFTPPNPFIPNLTSPTMSPNQFLFPAPHPPFTSYDPRVMAAYQSFYSRLPFVSHLGINLDMARKSFEMAKTNVSPLPSLPSTSASSAPQPKNNVKKKDKNEKSLQNAVEKLTQNKIKEAKLETTTTSTTMIGKENSDIVEKKRTETQEASKAVAEGPPSSSVPVAAAPETKK